MATYGLTMESQSGKETLAMNKIRKIITTTLATSALVTIGGTVAVNATADAAAPTVRVCADSNGPARGGSVYLRYGGGFVCDVRQPQRLHLTNTPSAKACADRAGRGWTSTVRICWDVDY